MSDKAKRAGHRRKIFERGENVSYLGPVIEREGGFGLVVRGISQVEDLLDEALSKHDKWVIVKDLARTVDDKMRLAHALDIIDADHYAVMRALNRLRNEVSHEWNAIVDDRRIKQLMTSLPKHVSTRITELIEMAQKKTNLTNTKVSEPWMDALAMVITTVVLRVNGKWALASDAPKSGNEV